MIFACVNKIIWLFFLLHLLMRWASLFECSIMLAFLRQILLLVTYYLSLFCRIQFTNVSVQFSLSVMSNFLWLHELQHTRPPCPSPTPGGHPNPCPLSQWYHPTISSSVVHFSSCPQSFPALGFSSESGLRSRWPKYWGFSFNISPFNVHPGLISFRMDWLDLLAVQGTLKSSPTP